MSKRTRPEAYVSPLVATIELVRGRMADAANYERTERGIARFCVEPVYLKAILAGAEQLESALAAMREERETLRFAFDRLQERLGTALADVAHLTEEREGLRAKLRGLPPTVAAGLIQRLQDENAALTEEREGLFAVAKREGWYPEDMTLAAWIAYLVEAARRLKAENVALRDNNQAVKALFDARAEQLAALTAAQERVKTLLTDVASSGFEDIDPRIDYVDVQIDRELWTELRSALTSLEGPPQETR